MKRVTNKGWIFKGAMGAAVLLMAAAMVQAGDYNIADGAVAVPKSQISWTVGTTTTSGMPALQSMVVAGAYDNGDPVTGNLTWGGTNGIWSSVANLEYTGTGSLVYTPTATGHKLTGIGNADNALLNSGAGYSTFGGVAVTTDSALVRYTWLGDANLDGSVNDQDYNLWKDSFIHPGTYPSDFLHGDWNYDGAVNDQDYNLWKDNFIHGATPITNPAAPSSPSPSAGPAAAPTPEPGTIALLLVGGLVVGGLSVARRSRRFFRQASNQLTIGSAPERRKPSMKARHLLTVLIVVGLLAAASAVQAELLTYQLVAGGVYSGFDPDTGAPIQVTTGVTVSGDGKTVTLGSGAPTTGYVAMYLVATLANNNTTFSDDGFSGGSVSAYTSGSFGTTPTLRGWVNNGTPAGTGTIDAAADFDPTANANAAFLKDSTSVRSPYFSTKTANFQQASWSRGLQQNVDGDGDIDIGKTGTMTNADYVTYDGQGSGTPMSLLPQLHVDYGSQNGGSSGFLMGKTGTAGNTTAGTAFKVLVGEVDMQFASPTSGQSTQVTLQALNATVGVYNWFKVDGVEYKLNLTGTAVGNGTPVTIAVSGGTGSGASAAAVQLASFTTSATNILKGAAIPFNGVISNSNTGVSGQETLNWTITGPSGFSPASGTALAVGGTVGTSASLVASNYGSNSFTLTVTGAGPTLAANPATDSKTATVLNVGQATANKSGATPGTYGTPLTGGIASGLSAILNAATGTGNPGILTGVGNAQGTEAIIPLVASGATGNVSMAFRTRADNEIPGTATHPHIPTGLTGLTSDVVDVTGISGAFVMQLSYNDSGFNGAETHALQGGALYLATAASAGSDFVNAGGAYDGTTKGYPGSWAAFALANGVNAGNLSTFVGDWGVDTANNVAWAVRNNASGDEFAVVPEPSTILLLLVGGLALLPRVIRRKRA